MIKYKIEDQSRPKGILLQVLPPASGAFLGMLMSQILRGELLAKNFADWLWTILSDILVALFVGWIALVSIRRREKKKTT